MNSRIALSTILDQNPPYAPSPRTTSTASSTRDVSPQEIKYSIKDQLRAVVYVDNLVEQLTPAAKAWANTVRVDPADPVHAQWLAHVSPEFTHHLLSPVVNSEQDSRDWFNSVLARPALAALRAVCAGSIQSIPDPSTAAPYISSSHGEKNKPIPDGILVNEVWKAPGEVVSLTIELKTDNAMRNDVFEDAQVDRFRPGSPRPLAIPFLWPSGEEGKIKKQAKLLVQVHSQMTKHQVQYAILSSYHSTVFLYRANNLLYMSPTYALQESSPTLVFAWLSQSLNLIPRSPFSVPSVDMGCVEMTERPGWVEEHRAHDHTLHGLLSHIADEFIDAITAAPLREGHRQTRSMSKLREILDSSAISSKPSDAPRTPKRTQYEPSTSDNEATPRPTNAQKRSGKPSGSERTGRR